MKIALTKSVIEQITKLTEKLVNNATLIKVVNDWAAEHNLVFMPDPMSTEFNKEFRIIAPGYDISLRYFPGYKTVWVSHSSGLSAKFGFNEGLTKPLVSMDAREVAEKLVNEALGENIRTGFDKTQ